MFDRRKANWMRWTRQPGHYEVWYATLSHAASKTGFWIRYTLEAPFTGHGAPHAALWFARFDAASPLHTFGFTRRFPIEALSEQHDPFQLRIAEALLTDESMRGALASEGDQSHRVSWDLQWPASATVHTHLPAFAYCGSLADTQVVSPNLHVPARGSIEVDGRVYEFDGEPLGQSHVWGRKHAYSWAWSHVAGFAEAPDATLETLTVRLRRGSMVLPTLTLLSLYLGGQKAIHFREPWQLPLARSRFATGRYDLHAAGIEYRIDAELTCRPDDMIMAEYVDPDGDAAYCHNTICGDAKVTLWRRSPRFGRFHPVQTLNAARTAHFEWGARAGDRLVTKRLVALPEL